MHAPTFSSGETFFHIAATTFMTWLRDHPWCCAATSGSLRARKTRYAFFARLGCVVCALFLPRPLGGAVCVVAGGSVGLRARTF